MLDFDGQRKKNTSSQPLKLVPNNSLIHSSKVTDLNTSNGDVNGEVSASTVSAALTETNSVILNYCVIMSHI